MSTPQEYWDACLIKTWRNIGTFYDLNKMFHSIVGKWPTDMEPRLLRTPLRWTPGKMQVRYYVAHFLPKINDRLHAQPPEKDVFLLRKLQESNYDTAKDYLKSETEKERDAVSRQHSFARKVNAHNIKAITERNHETDWNKVKGGHIRRAR